MGILNLFRRPAPVAKVEPRGPRAMSSGGGAGILITSPEQLEAALREGNLTESGQAVTPENAMRVAAVYSCVRLIAGTVANMPLQVKRRKGDNVREDASDHPLWLVLARKPNRWQKPAQFKRMCQAHVLLRGNSYSLKVFDLKGRVKELLPLHPDRVTVEQFDDLSITFTYIDSKGRRRVFRQNEILHLYNLTLNGLTGVTPITYARETIGAAMAMEQHGSQMFRNGARVSGVLSHPKQLTSEGLENLRASLDDYRQGGGREGKDLVLEEGMSYTRMAMTSEDAQWIEARNLSRSDIYRYFGVPPHMAGDVSGSTSWGTGIEEQTNGFVTFTLEDHLTMWEEAGTVDLLSEDDLYCRFNRGSLVRGNLKARGEYYSKGLQWGYLSPNEVRGLEDMNPREDGGGDDFYDPPNTAGGTPANEENNP